MVAKVRTAQVGFGNTWEDALVMARRLQNNFGSDDQTIEEGDLTFFGQMFV